MPVVTVELLEGRTVQQKRDMAKRITDAVTEVTGVSPEIVEVIFHDMKKENYAIGGILQCDRG
ncbi:MAG: 4-oxalocrotonate tautomerase [Actinobacteria bacterium]|nr:4-oxalocrotonate tautomerase [Actinomycetota bacterium]